MRVLLGIALTVLSVVAMIASPAEAQRIYRIGGLTAGNQFLPALVGFKQRMAELGYVEGKNIAYDFRNANGNHETLKELAAALVQQKSDLIVTSSTTATVAITKSTHGTTLPVVFLSAGNPLQLVKSYASSGNNLTGVTTALYDLVGKQMQLMREILPRLRKIVLLVNPTGSDYEPYIKNTREAAKKLYLQVNDLEIRAISTEEVKQQLPRISNKLGDGILIAPSITFGDAIADITRQAVKENLPCFGPYAYIVEGGLIAGYTVDFKALGRQGAFLVDKILKGAKPSNLPIEQPEKLNLVINLKTARAFGLDISKDLLLQADELIR